ncbi:MAG: hypothetical protein GY822_12970 [Deltaproteobacteria bacterium]|nr:hypothetical protein [Deltaproteobacteria bacterium]
MFLFSRTRQLSKAVLIPLSISFCFLVSGCGPLEVNADPTGAKLLPLSGKLSIEGSLKRDLKVLGKVHAKGTKVRVLETWLIRKDSNKTPPAYRIKGLYDPAVQSSGFVLPDRAVEVFALCAVGPDYKKNIAVPLAELVRKTP